MSTLMRLRTVGAAIYYCILLAITVAMAADALLLSTRGGLPGQTLLTITANLLAIFLAAMGLIYLRRHEAEHVRRIQSVEQEKRQLARYDELTGVLNRRHFMERLKQAVGTFRDDSSLTLVILDVDEFKQLNDSYGHPAGDQALVAVTNFAHSAFPDAVIGRLGGDEFAIMVPGHDLSRCRELLRTFYGHLKAPVRLDRFAMPLSVSMGVAAVPLHTTELGELISLADLALYQSKAAGRGRATFFDPEMLYDESQRRFMERELRAAIRLNQLELHYQPVVNPDNSIFGFEALVRWNHAYRGRIQPGEFIPVAERSMLIDHLGEWVFKRACKDVDDFPGCRISINISAAQLQREELVTMIERVLAESRVQADRFVLEITETAMASASTEVVGRLETLRAMGFRIALDDFGTGFCGFNYLNKLPIDSIKIDRSYIQRLEDDEVARVFVASLSQIGRAMDITVVAEGIETEAERALAVASGCNRLQGFLISRPFPKAEIRSRYLAELQAAA